MPPPQVELDWSAPPMWPSEAGPSNPIKLPRQTKVQQVLPHILHTVLVLNFEELSSLKRCHT